MTQRVVFLDIDGVLAPIRRWDRYGDIERACIEVLNEIVASARADVVVSSTWRHGKTVAELQAMLEAAGFTGRVVDKTPTVAPGASRPTTSSHRTFRRCGTSSSVRSDTGTHRSTSAAGN